MRGGQQILAGNKSLTRKWLNKEQELHIKKLLDAKPTINFYEGTFRFSKNSKRRKKEQMLEDRFTEIERENRILLEKVTNIMRSRKNSKLYFPLDDTPSPSKKSLNSGIRKRELMKITMENQAFLKRLEGQSPIYNVAEWNLQNKVHNKLIKNLSMFQDKPRRISPTRAGSRYDHSFVEPRTAFSQTEKQINLGANSNSNPRHIKTSSSNTSQKLEPIIRAKSLLDQKRDILFKKARKIGNNYYIIEISKVDENMLIIAFDTENPETLLIEIPKEKEEALVLAFNNDYERMVNQLHIIDRKLVIMAPPTAPKPLYRKITPKKPPTRNARSVPRGAYSLSNSRLSKNKSSRQMNEKSPALQGNNPGTAPKSTAKLEEWKDREMLPIFGAAHNHHLIPRPPTSANHSSNSRGFHKAHRMVQDGNIPLLIKMENFGFASNRPPASSSTDFHQFS